jgi:NADH-quinone oxidoreductase subunit N
VFSKPAESSPVNAVPRPSFALLCALFLTAAATLVMGIAPGGILAGAQAAAATYGAAQGGGAAQAGR